MKVCKEITFDMAHRLPYHEGRCRNIHGHTFKLLATFQSDMLIEQGSSAGMVVDFKHIKKILTEYVDSILDHSLTLSIYDEYCKQLLNILGYEDIDYEHLYSQVIIEGLVHLDNKDRVNVCNFIPTSENLVRWLFDKLYNAIEENDVTLFSLQLFETPTSSAIMTVSDYDSVIK